MFELSTTLIWAIIGLILIVLEVFTTTFFLLFFGVSALLVAVIKLFGLEYLPAEIIIFAALGIVGTFFFRKKITKSFRSTKTISIDKEKTVSITEAIPAGKSGSVMYQGAPWQAINESEEELKEGEEAVIDRIEGVKLILKQK